MIRETERVAAEGSAPGGVGKSGQEVGAQRKLRRAPMRMIRGLVISRTLFDVD
jgi:hypothetical protein